VTRPSPEPAGSLTASLLVGLSLALVAPLGADTIVLTNGRVIEADRTWYEGSQLFYEKNGGVFGLPRSLVKTLDQHPAPEPVSDPDVRKARECLAAGDPATASRLLRLALTRSPRSISAHQALTEAYLSLGDRRAALRAAQETVALDGRNPISLSLLGDALTAMGDSAGAEAEYRKSLKLHPDASVQRKLDEVAPPPVRPSQGALFRLRYDGGVNETLGITVLKALTDDYNEFVKRLGFTPEDAITVVLQTEAAFQEGGAPDWAAGVNDGTIRVPVRGMERPTPQMLSVLRHELGHSFITARTGGNCPTWLQEGISQWLEGGDPARGDAALAGTAREGRLLALLTLEAPFQNLSSTDASLAYAESLSAVAHILRKRGEVGLNRLVSALADRLPSEEALPVALAFSYPEFQKSWQDYLRTLEAKP